MSKAIGTAALAGALGFGSTAEAGHHHQKKNAEITRTHKVNKQEQQNILARTIWAEARENGEDGMRAVASVIHNRGAGNIGKMIQVIEAPKQFSCWNKMTKADWSNFKIKERSGPEWKIANKIASEMMENQFTPITDATHYYNPKKVTPGWAFVGGRLRPNDIIGDHRFMKIS
jgi:N-acetylmuramoyl-L-alanine amidase